MATIAFPEGFAELRPAHPVHLRKQLLNNVVDGMAQIRPQTLFAELPTSPTSFEAGYRKVTYRAFANAINGAAWWLTKELGPGKDFEALPYMGWHDIRYAILLLGAVKAGYKVISELSVINPVLTYNFTLVAPLDITI